MKNLIFISPPASGKGTYSNILKEKYNYKHISTGNLLREEIEKDTDLGKLIAEKIDNGHFVDDQTITTLLFNKLQSILKDNNIILDGYPRNINQINILNKIFDDLNVSDEYLAIYLNIDKKLAQKRILGRAICNNCGAIYNLNSEAKKPKTLGICDICNSKLIHREDDNLETFNTRYDTYLNDTAPVIEYYQNINKLLTIKITEDNDNVIEEIEKVIVGD